MQSNIRQYFISLIQNMTIVTRFAPSPTGMLHIGGARTALFNYLFAKKYGGKFLLRIEDTDVARSTNEAKEAILNGMNWLGINWDGDVVYQMSRKDRHLEVAKKLIASGAAYYAYDDVEEIKKERELAEKSGKIYRYNPKWRNCKDKPSGIEPAIRLLIDKQKIKFKDEVKGDMEFDSSEIDDFVIVRSDGTPTYMFAVVVDDIDMAITHVIRGDDHLSNTPKQILIYNAIGAKNPTFAHIPLIHDISGQKLSKRKGAVAVDEYEKMGYLPESVCNYLMQLGWNSGEGDKLLSLNEAAAIFSLERLGTSPSRFDFDKLNYINLQFIQSKNEDQLMQIVKSKFTSLSPEDESSIRLILGEIKKSSTINQMLDLARLFISNQDINYTAEAVSLIQQNKDKISLLKNFISSLNIDNFKPEFDIFLKENNFKFSQIGPVLRSILIGIPSSINLGSIIKSLGRDDCLNRFNLAQKIND